MQLYNYFYWFKDAVPKNICDDIVRYAKQLQEQMAVTGGVSNKKLNEKEIKNIKEKRDSDVVWLDERWIYTAIHPYIFFISLLFLFLVPLFGVEVKGSKRWIEIPFFLRFQPVELVKKVESIFNIFAYWFISREKSSSVPEIPSANAIAASFPD